MTALKSCVFALCLAALTTGCLATDRANRVEDGTQDIAKTNDTMCFQEQHMIEMAVESFTLLEGHVPTEAEMVPSYLRIQSPYYDIDMGGNVVPAPGGGCLPDP